MVYRGLPFEFWSTLLMVLLIYSMPLKFDGMWIRIPNNLARPTGIWSTRSVSVTEDHLVSATYRSVFDFTQKTIRGISCKDFIHYRAIDNGLLPSQQNLLAQALIGCEPAQKLIEKVVNTLTNYSVVDSEEAICGRFKDPGYYMRDLPYYNISLFCAWSTLECVIPKKQIERLKNVCSFCPNEADWMRNIIAKHVVGGNVVATYWDVYDRVTSIILAPFWFLF